MIYHIPIGDCFLYLLANYGGRIFVLVVYLYKCCVCESDGIITGRFQLNIVKRGRLVAMPADLSAIRFEYGKLNLIVFD